MAVALVDRLFWRAGFGPTQAQRDAWVGKKQSDLVDWFLNTPESLDTSMPRAEDHRGLDADRPVRRPRWSSSSSGWTACSARSTRCRSGWRCTGIATGSIDQRRLGLGQVGLRLPQPAARVLGLRQVPGRVVQAARVRHDDQERRDVVVPEPQREHEDQAERELRPRDHGAVLPRPKDADGNDNYTQADIVGVTQAFTGWRLNGTEFLPGRRHAQPGLRQDHVQPGQLPHAGQDDPRPHGPGRDRARRTRRPTRTA